MNAPPILLSGVLLTLLLIFLRLLSITPSITRSSPRKPANPHILYVLGSGGHTAEMLALISSVKPHKRTYLISHGDTLSAKKAAAFESVRDGGGGGKYGIVEVPRARRVGQGWVSTPWSCVVCFVGCARALARFGVPDVVVCNGPGSAVMVVAVCFLYKFFGLCATRVIYVESFARVRSLSLSGKLLYAFADRFVVQWPGLVGKYPRAEYHGILI